ncbi:MAG: ribonuclease J, partial [Cyanobacteria bacterium J083]
HIGGISYHLKSFDIPIIYGPRLAMALLQDKLTEAGVLEKTKLKTVAPRETVKLGKHFKVEFIRNTHSIADSFSIALHTPLGVIIHTGDFKIDHTPMDGETFDLQKIAEYGEKGVLALLSDSTNAEVPGHTPSERSVYPNLERIFAQAPGRLMVTTFASSVHRVRIILELAQKYHRKVVIVGRSMLNVIAHARNLGYIQCPDDIFEPLKSLNRLPEDKTLILTTGSQGEPLAALTRISRNQHRQIRVRQGDTIVFSANPIPGNTIAVVNTIDRLMMMGANVIYGKDKGIHVSGHGSQEDHKLMLALTRPKFFVPVHGEHRMLIKHAQMAYSMGIPVENTVIVNNGDIIELSPDNIAVTGRVPSGIALVDRSGIVEDNVMEQRQQLAEDGVITVSATINEQTGEQIGNPEIVMRGIAGQVEKANLVKQLIVKTINNIIGDRYSKYKNTSKKDEINLTNLRLEIESSIQRLAKRELQSTPLVVFILHSVNQSPVRVSRRRTRSAASSSVAS